MFGGIGAAAGRRTCGYRRLGETRGRRFGSRRCRHTLGRVAAVARRRSALRFSARRPFATTGFCRSRASGRSGVAPRGGGAGGRCPRLDGASDLARAGAGRARCGVARGAFGSAFGRASAALHTWRALVRAVAALGARRSLVLPVATLGALLALVGAASGALRSATEGAAAIASGAGATRTTLAIAVRRAAAAIFIGTRRSPRRIVRTALGALRAGGSGSAGAAFLRGRGVPRIVSLGRTRCSARRIVVAAVGGAAIRAAMLRCARARCGLRGAAAWLCACAVASFRRRAGRGGLGSRARRGRLLLGRWTFAVPGARRLARRGAARANGGATRRCRPRMLGCQFDAHKVSHSDRAQQLGFDLNLQTAIGKAASVQQEHVLDALAERIDPRRMDAAIE